MTAAQELAADLHALCVEVGGECGAHILLMVGQYHNGNPTFTAVLEPKGTMGKVRLSAPVYELADAAPALRAMWDEHKDLHASNTIKSMAFAIIRLTAEQGECTDAALRAEFDAREVADYGDRAADLATEMGGNGPFRVIRLTGANDMGEAA